MLEWEGEMWRLNGGRLLVLIWGLPYGDRLGIVSRLRKCIATSIICMNVLMLEQ